MSRSILSSLLLFSSLLLPVWLFLNAESAPGLIVAMSSSLDVLHSVDPIGLIVDGIDEGVCHTLVGGTQKSVQYVCVHV